MTSTTDTKWISLIAAMGENRVIGRENKLPWKLPADMKWFRQQTLGKPIIMGRKTFESFGAKPLPKRTNVVVTREKDYQPDGAVVVHSVEEALSATQDAEEVMIIGGASFYEQMLARANRIYLTLIHHSFEGDAWFPQYEMNQWQEKERIDCEADESNPYAYSFIILERVAD